METAAQRLRGGQSGPRCQAGGRTDQFDGAGVVTGVVVVVEVVAEEEVINISLPLKN